MTSPVSVYCLTSFTMTVQDPGQDADIIRLGSLILVEPSMP